MPMGLSLDLRDLMAVDIRCCCCAECCPGGRCWAKGLITPGMLKVNGRVRETADVSGTSEVQEALSALGHWIMKEQFGDPECSFAPNHLDTDTFAEAWPKGPKDIYFGENPV